MNFIHASIWPYRGDGHVGVNRPKVAPIRAALYSAADNPFNFRRKFALAGVHREAFAHTVFPMENRGNDLAALQAALAGLTPSQMGWVQGVILQFKLPHDFQRADDSDFVTDAVLERMGDALRIHHAFSRQALSKDRFEFALERALNLSGIEAELVRSRTNRGHDITIAGVPVSLKTEAAASAYSSFNSMPVHRRPSSFATTPVVPDPKKGSSTRSPAADPAAMQRRTNARG